MAKKSKTQRAKASAARAAKKTVTEDKQDVSTQEVQAVEEPKKKLFSKSEPAADKPVKKAEAKPEKKAKKAGFLSEVRLELKRVTWPTRLDVVRWSGVVVVALIFFGVFVFVLDNWVVTPVLLAISSIGA